MIQRGPGGRLVGYELLPRMTGLRLDGQYAKVGHDVPPIPVIQFRSDGTFQEQALLANISYKIGDPQFAALAQVPVGAGTYAIRNNTLDLRYTDGRAFSIAIHPSTQEGPSQRPQTVYLNSCAFQRVG
jgi:hypothetical protein